MNQIIKLLRNINFWTILGTLIGLATLYFTVLQHKDNTVDYVLVRPGFAHSELKTNDTIRCILFGVDRLAPTDSVHFLLPIALKNQTDIGLNVDYQALSPYVKAKQEIGIKTDRFVNEVLILGGELCKLNYEIYPDAAKLINHELQIVTVDLICSYPKMSKRGNIRLYFLIQAVEPALIQETQKSSAGNTVFYLPEDDNPLCYIVAKVIQ